MILRNITLLLSLLLSISAYSQMPKTIDSLVNAKQKCLDIGIHMKNCSWIFYKQMDSLLNVQYNKQKVQLSEANKAKFRSEQLRWLSARNNYFKKLENEYTANLKSGEWGKDDRMIVWDDEAEFVKKRILAISK